MNNGKISKFAVAKLWRKIQFCFFVLIAELTFKPLFQNQTPAVEDLMSVDAQVLVIRLPASAGDDKGALDDERVALASLQDERGVFAPAEQDLIVVQVLVTRPLEELFLLLEKISSLWACGRLRSNP
jgi:hypothetical protein